MRRFLHPTAFLRLGSSIISAMTPKEKLIIDFLKRNQSKGFYLDLYDSLVFDFDDDEDFNRTLDELVSKEWVSEKDTGEALYELNERKLKK